MKWPDNKDFAFTMFDVTDYSNLEYNSPDFRTVS